VDDSHTCIYIAETLEQDVIGYVLGVKVDLAPEMFEQEPSGFLADIYVEESYRKFGVGRALVDALRDWFSEQGLRYFEWHVAARNEDALNFWKSLGGRETMIRMRADVPQKKDENGDNTTPVSDG
jgi:GNAT superfamily N-acetyltransferase